MKTFSLFVLLLTFGFLSSAQDQGPIPQLSKQLTDYYNANPGVKVYVTTDKTHYKPAETIWFQVLVTEEIFPYLTRESGELIVKLFDAQGKSEIQQLFKLKNGSASCDVKLPKEMSKGIYFLSVYSSESNTFGEVSTTALSIDPEYNNQWTLRTRFKDSISSAGQKNELYAELSDLGGEKKKNTTIRYQLTNGTEILEKGKIKSDENGKMTLPFTMPSKTNGQPFVLEINDKDTWENDLFVPSGLDSVVIRFFPEGGTLIPGTPSKIGFTAFNKWGIPVDAEGTILNETGSTAAQIKTFTRGLGFFSMVCEANQKYKLVLSGKMGEKQTFQLPVTDPKGLTLSVVKTDADFISANLIFADKQKHAVALTVTQGSSIFWAADMDVDGTGRIKIPAVNIPQGINLLSVFSKEGVLMGERIVYMDKKLELKVTVLPEKSSIAPDNTLKVKILLTNENNQPVAGNVTVRVSDQYRNEYAQPRINEFLLLGSVLETPFSLVSGAMKGKIAQSTLLDVFLIANKIKGHDWEKIKNFRPDQVQGGKERLNFSGNKNLEVQFSGYISKCAQNYKLMYRNKIPDATYLSNNAALFVKAPKLFKTNNTALDNQRKMFASSSSILEVIKTLKPYKVVSNQIVFIGSENSLNYQGGALIVLDGQQLGTDISALSSISPMEVDHINVSTNAMDIQRYTGLNSVGVIEIFQKKATVREVKTADESSEKYENGYRLPKQFAAEAATSKTDLRTTLQWIPLLSIDQTGQAEFSVGTGKVLSDFVVEVEGITTDGRLGHGQSNIKVVF